MALDMNVTKDPLRDEYSIFGLLLTSVMGSFFPKADN